MGPTAQRRIARFGVYEADLDTRQLAKSGLRIRVQDQPFQILALLLERQGQVVTREELKEKLWPGDTFVEFDAGLNTAIKKLRAALSDSADNPRFVETIPRRGYRLLVPVDFPAGPAPSDFSPNSPPTVPSSAVDKVVLDLPARPRMAAEQKGLQRRWLWVVTTGVVLVGFALYQAYVRRDSAVKLSEKDTIVLADFMNTTGDAVFDGTLKQALAVDLEQSPFLNVASDLQISETLHLMGRSPSEPLTREVAREVCLRMGSKAIMIGSIATLGSHYVVGLEALGCAGGDTLAKDQAESANKEGVLKTLGGVVSRVRSKAGESLSSLEKYDFPADTTTKSLEALKAYSIGERTVREKGEAESIPFFQNAIQLDPDFAIAYAALGGNYYILGEGARAEEYLTKAYSLRDRVSVRERYRITTMYHSEVTGDLEEEEAACKLWTEVYPRDPAAREGLGAVYVILGQYDRARLELQEALRLSPESAINYGNLAVAYISLDRLDDAKAVLDKAQARGLDGIIIHENLYSFSFLRGDVAEMERQVAWAAGKVGVEDQLLTQHSDTEAYHGRLRKARDLSRRAVESAVRGGDKETAAMWEINAALRELEIGNLSLARQGVRATLSLASSRDVKTLAALVLARGNDTVRAKELIAELEKGDASNTLLKAYWIPTLKASLEVHSGNPRAALSLLQAAAPYEMGEAAYVSNMYPAYERGQAYLLAHDGTAAAGEFKKLLDHPGIVQNDILGALSRLQLARAEVMAGDKLAAKKQYSDFLSLWKDADPEVPVLQEAKAEYGKL